jgi:hypothetical protein
MRQDSDTSDLYFGIEALVSCISQSMTLYPGDLIATGSPAGVAFFMKPPGFLRPSDRVKCEIERVGAVENLVRAEGHSAGSNRTARDGMGLSLESFALVLATSTKGATLIWRSFSPPTGYGTGRAGIEPRIRNEIPVKPA